MEQLAEMQDSDVAIPAADEPEQLDNGTGEENAEGDAQLDGEGNPVVEDQAESDEEEIDYDGEKYKVPKKLREAFLRQQDYTQKTQAIAEQRREVEAKAQEIHQQAEVQKQFIAEVAEVHSLDSHMKSLGETLRQYAQLDWASLERDDPSRAASLNRQRLDLHYQMQELQQKRGEVVASVTQKQQQQALQMQQETAKRLQEGRAVLEREVKGWAPGNEVDMALSKYGEEIGVPKGLIAQVPKVGVLLHKAFQLDQLMKKQATPKEKPKPQEKPVTRISATKGTATKDPSQMTDAEFAAWRKRQIAQRR